MENFLPGLKTKIAGFILMAYGLAKVYFDVLNTQDPTQGVYAICSGLGLIGIRVAMTTETDRKIQAYGQQLSEVTKIILANGKLVQPDAPKVPDQKMVAVDDLLKAIEPLLSNQPAQAEPENKG